MKRPVLFFDLAGTLEVHDPATRRWGLWPGADLMLADLAADFELHLTTGDDPAGAASSLREMDIREFFMGVHAALPGGGKPFGMIAASLGRRPQECLAIGDSAVNDTAGDTEDVVSVILDQGDQLVAPARLTAVVRELAAGDDFLAGFQAAYETAAAGTKPDPFGEPLHDAALGGGCRLGWWRKSATAQRAVVVLAG